ncbi:MAG: DUF3800 domain-containing protein [Asticcacaulis sp.]
MLRRKMANSPKYDYVCYIDEAGDDGLKIVRPADPTGSSEWLIVSGVVVSAKREDEVTTWIEDIRDGLWNYQARSIHFAKLNPNKKQFVCEKLSQLNARYFVVCSNKKNMKGYSNPLAAEVPSQCWFYNWMTRLLLERVTDYVSWRSMKDHGEIRKVKLEFSNRGGLSYSQMDAYFRWISYQGKNTFLKFGNVNWEAIDPGLLKVYPHYERAGLQLADIVASSFYKAVDIYNTGSCDAQFAKLLDPRMARYRDQRSSLPSGYGVKLMPWSLPAAKLHSDQEAIFRHYGYPKQWWAPDPYNPSAF